MYSGSRFCALIRFYLNKISNRFSALSESTYRSFFSLFIVLLLIPFISMVVRDYTSDNFLLERALKSKQEEVNRIVKNYNEILQGLESHVLNTKAYKSEKKIISLLKDVEELKKHSESYHIQNISGLRWIGIDNVVHGPFGRVRTQSPEDISALLASFKKSAHNPSFIRRGNVIYLGRGVKEDKSFIGCFVMQSPALPGTLPADDYKLSLIKAELPIYPQAQSLTIKPNYKFAVFEYVKGKSLSILIMLVMAGLLCSFVAMSSSHF